MTLVIYSLFYILFMTFSYMQQYLYLLYMLVMMMIYFFFYSMNFNYISMMFHTDMLSLSLMFLTILVICYMYLSEYLNMDNMYMYTYVFLLIFLLLSFSLDSALMFYIFFESSLFPLMYLIFNKGSTPERFKASYNLFMYTVSSSLPLLFCILSINNFNGSVSFYYFFNFDSIMTNYYYLICYLAFFVKSPMYFFHLWLPKAHVEAPVTGSMILAGVLLKLGGYGLYRFMFFMYMKKFYLFSCFIWSVSLLGGVIVSLLCLRQFDLKMLIAYSSVSHMSLIICSLMSQLNLATNFILLMMLAHGVCSSCLFYISNMYYSRSHSRNMFLLSGISVFYPVLSYLWFCFIVFNMSCPPSMNFFSEVLVLILMMKYSFINMIMLILFSMLSASYCLVMFTRIYHGKNWFLKNYFLIDHKEYLVLIMHLLPLIFYMFLLVFIF